MLGGRGGSTIDFGHAGPVATFAAASLKSRLRQTPPQGTTFIKNSRSLRQSRQMRPLPGGVTGMAQTMTTGGDVQAQWARVRGRLRDKFGDAAFRRWIKSMTLAEVSVGRVRIGVPTRFLRDWVAAHYADRIRALWNGENGAIAAIDIFVSGGGMPVAEIAGPAIIGGEEPRESGGRGRRPPDGGAHARGRKDIHPPPHPPLTLAKFLVGQAHATAPTVARRVAAS